MLATFSQSSALNVRNGSKADIKYHCKFQDDTTPLPA